MHATSSRLVNSQLRVCFITLAVAAAALIVACSSGDRTLDEVDPQAVAAEPTFDQVNAIIHNKCVMCHDSGGGEDGGGGSDFRIVEEDDKRPFTTCTEIVAERFEILDRVQDNTMPPGAMPRLSSEEKLTIERWVANGAPAPCNSQP
jgi:uncharacterized membrane protein